MDRSQLSPEDAQLLSRFHRGRCPPSAWTHEVFVRLAWAFYRIGGQTFASASLREGLAHLAKLNPDDKRFVHHETLTRFWLTMITAADRTDQMPSTSSREFIWRHPELLDQRLPLKFYSKRLLDSEEARLAFHPPETWRDRLG